MRSMNSLKALYIEYPEEEYAAVEKLKASNFVSQVWCILRAAYRMQHKVYLVRLFDALIDPNLTCKSPFILISENIW